MDILDVLEALALSVHDSPWIPVANLRAVDRTVLARLLAAAREETLRGQRAPAAPMSQEEMLTQANNESRLLLEEARREADTLLKEERIKALTRQRVDEIVDEGREHADSMVQAAYSYSAERMAEAEERLRRLSKELGAGLETLGKDIKTFERGHRQRKREEKKGSRKKR